VLCDLTFKKAIDGFTHQEAFKVTSKKKHYVDFVVYVDDDTVYLEAKGMDLALGRLKREIVEEREGIKIHVVKKPSEILDVLNARLQVPGHTKSVSRSSRKKKGRDGEREKA
jgi:hypothetical protein